jgi:hypothetical protein
MEIMHKTNAAEAANDENDGKGKDVSSMEENDPWNPPYPPCVPAACKDLTGRIEAIQEWLSQKHALLAASRATHTIIEQPIQSSQTVLLSR